MAKKKSKGKAGPAKSKELSADAISTIISAGKLDASKGEQGENQETSQQKIRRGESTKSHFLSNSSARSIKIVRKSELSTKR